jgi:hypothetical protein
MTVVPWAVESRQSWRDETGRDHDGLLEHAVLTVDQNLVAERGS